MNERTKSILKTVLAIVLFIVGVAFVVVGQRHIGPQGLLVMLLGLVGLILLLYLYNRKFK